MNDSASERPPVVDDVVARHAEDAAFLWHQRDRAARAPSYRLRDLLRFDNRLAAHLDGLLVSGEYGWRLASEGLGSGEAENAFVAAWLALARPDHSFGEVLAQVEAADVSASRGVASALAWHGETKSAPWLTRLAESQLERSRLVSVAARAGLRAIQREDLERALGDPSALVRSRALRAVGEMGRLDLVSPLRYAFNDVSNECRYWAAWSATLLRDPSGNAALFDVVHAEAHRTETAVDLALRTCEPENGTTFCRQLISQGHVRLAIVAVRALGDSALIPWLLDVMSQVECARLAGDAFATFAGLDLVREHLDTDAPPDSESGPNDDPDDENVATDVDDGLPWPATAEIRKWWEKNRRQFAEGHRHMLGNRLSPESIRHALITGTQWQRYAAALEISLQRPGSPLLQTRAVAARQ